MKKQIILASAFLGLFFTACQNSGGEPTSTEPTPTETTAQAPAGDAIDSTATGDYTVDTQASSVEWVGAKAAGASHNGTIKLQGGELKLYGGRIVGGKVTVDMNSIDVLGLDASMKGKLEGHLKSPDFFDVAKFPTASFSFGSTMPGDAAASNVVAGELMMKGISKPIRIPFNTSFADGKLTVESPEFSIIRTEWGVQYKSGILGTIKDEIINDEIKLKIKLVAAPKAQ